MSDRHDKQKLFTGSDGLPTAPDVELLLRTWPDPKVGDRFEYDAVEKLLGVRRETARWKTVTEPWRKRMLQKGLVVECERGKAFFVASADQVSAATWGTLSSIVNKARGQRKKLAVQRPADEGQRMVIEHQARLLHVVEKDTKKHRMNLLPATKASEVPRIAPPHKAGKPKS